MKRNKLSISQWIGALRIFYTIPFVATSLTGIVAGVVLNGHGWIAICILLETFFFAMFVNISNDYFDHKSGVDKVKQELHYKKMGDKYGKEINDTVFWNGNAFDLGIVSETWGKWVLSILLCLLFIFAIPVFLHAGFVIVIVGAIGLFVSFFYTAPPLNLGSKGLGAISAGVSFFLISYFSYYFINPDFSLWIPFLVAVQQGLLAFAMRATDQLTGYDAHRATDEKDIAVRMGVPFVVNLTKTVVVLFYIFVGITSIFNPWFLLSFTTIGLSIPIFVAFKTKKPSDEELLQAVKGVLGTCIANSLVISVAWILSVYF